MNDERHEAHLDDIRGRAGLEVSCESAATAALGGLSRHAQTEMQRRLYGALGRALAAGRWIEARTEELRDDHRDLLRASIEEMQQILADLEVAP